MSSPKAKVKQFNEDVSCASPVGHYDPLLLDRVKVPSLDTRGEKLKRPRASHQSRSSSMSSRMGITNSESRESPSFARPRMEVSRCRSNSAMSPREKEKDLNYQLRKVVSERDALHLRVEGKEKQLENIGCYTIWVEKAYYTWIMWSMTQFHGDATWVIREKEQLESIYKSMREIKIMGIEVAWHAKDLSNAKKKLQSAGEHVEDLRKKLGAKKEESDGLRRKLEAKKEESGGLRRKLEAKDEESDNLRRKLEAKKEESDDLRRKLEAKKEESDDLRRKRKATDKGMDHLERESKHRDSEEEVVGLELGGGKWKMLYNERCKEFEPYKHIMEKYEMERQVLLSKTEVAQKEVETLISKFTQMVGRRNHEQKVQYVAKLEQENSDLKEAHAKLQAMDITIRRRLEKLTGGLEKGKKRFDPAVASGVNKMSGPELEGACALPGRRETLDVRRPGSTDGASSMAADGDKEEHSASSRVLEEDLDDDAL